MIVEASADLDTLNAALATAEERLVSVERLHATGGQPLRSIFWIHDESGETLGEDLAADSTVTAVRELSRTDDARLYRAHHPDSTALSGLYDAAVLNDVLLLDAIGDAEGWLLKCWMPDRDCLNAFREACAAHDIDLNIRSMYNDEPQSAGDLYGLTEPQREILLLAVQTGYFRIPRDITLADLAAKLDLSSQAASERLRRGMRTLVKNVIDDRRPLFNGMHEFDREK